MKYTPKVHTISAQWLFSTDEDDHSRVWIRGKWVYGIRKDWDYDWDKYPKNIIYRHKPRSKERFLGYCQNQYAFKLACRGDKCSWSHCK